MNPKCKIEYGLCIDSANLAAFSTGGEALKQKTRSARKKNFLKEFGNTNFKPEELIISN